MTVVTLTLKRTREFKQFLRAFEDACPPHRNQVTYKSIFKGMTSSGSLYAWKGILDCEANDFVELAERWLDFIGTNYDMHYRVLPNTDPYQFSYRAAEPQVKIISSIRKNVSEEEAPALSQPSSASDITTDVTNASSVNKVIEAFPEPLDPNQIIEDAAKSDKCNEQDNKSTLSLGSGGGQDRDSSVGDDKSILSQKRPHVKSKAVTDKDEVQEASLPTADAPHAQNVATDDGFTHVGRIGATPPIQEQDEEEENQDFASPNPYQTLADVEPENPVEEPDFVEELNQQMQDEGMMPSRGPARDSPSDTMYDKMRKKLATQQALQEEQALQEDRDSLDEILSRGGSVSKKARKKKKNRASSDSSSAQGRERTADAESDPFAAFEPLDGSIHPVSYRAYSDGFSRLTKMIRADQAHDVDQSDMAWWMYKALMNGRKQYATHLTEMSRRHVNARNLFAYEVGDKTLDSLRQVSVATKEALEMIQVANKDSSQLRDELKELRRMPIGSNGGVDENTEMRIGVLEEHAKVQAKLIKSTVATNTLIREVMDECKDEIDKLERRLIRLESTSGASVITDLEHRIEILEQAAIDEEERRAEEAAKSINRQPVDPIVLDGDGDERDAHPATVHPPGPASYHKQASLPTSTHAPYHRQMPVSAGSHRPAAQPAPAPTSASYSKSTATPAYASSLGAAPVHPNALDPHQEPETWEEEKKRLRAKAKGVQPRTPTIPYMSHVKVRDNFGRNHVCWLHNWKTKLQPDGDAYQNYYHAVDKDYRNHQFYEDAVIDVLEYTVP